MQIFLFLIHFVLSFQTQSAKKEHVCILPYSINFQQKVTEYFQKKISKMWIDCTKIAS